jgi:hypothetical protein
MVKNFIFMNYNILIVYLCNVSIYIVNLVVDIFGNYNLVYPRNKVETHFK